MHCNALICIICYMSLYDDPGMAHAVVASCSELYFGRLGLHINGVWPVFLLKQLNLVAIT